MRIVFRKNIPGTKGYDGYAANLQNLTQLEEIEITKPFVFIAGLNGTGKSAILKSMRRSMGILESEIGTTKPEYKQPLNIAECKDDLALLSNPYTTMDGIMEPKDPGILDVEKLEWMGQQTWLFDSKKDVIDSQRSHFSNDIRSDLIKIFNAQKASSGEYLNRGFWDALKFASGFYETKDEYDYPESLSPAQQEFFKRIIKRNGGTRSSEKWLLLDEPETSQDHMSFIVNMSYLMEKAEIGKLRVFCVSHSPLLPLKFADHPNIQILETSPSFIEKYKKTLEFIEKNENMKKVADKIETMLKAQKDDIEKEEKGKKKKNKKGDEAKETPSPFK